MMLVIGLVFVMGVVPTLQLLNLLVPWRVNSWKKTELEDGSSSAVDCAPQSVGQLQLLLPVCGDV